MLTKEATIGGASALALGGVGCAVTNSTIEEPPKEIVRVRNVSVEIKEVEVKSIILKYLKRFFNENKDLKNGWSAVLELSSNQCDTVTDTIYSDTFISRKVLTSIETYSEGKFKNRKDEITRLLNKLSMSISSARNNSGTLPEKKEFCPEIKEAYKKIDEILGSIGSK